MANRVDVAVIGAGISGLSTAFWLSRQGHSLKVLEKEDRVGGSIETTYEDGFLIEHGPNSGLETNPLIAKLSRELDIDDQMIYANEEANNRYIVRNSRLHSLPMSPPKFIGTDLFSWRAKLRVLGEFFVGEGSNEETVADFVSRRLGSEFLDYAINPFVAGVFAGDPTELSVRAAFPKLVALEDDHGGIFKGVIKGRRERKKRAEAGEESKQSARMFSYRNGLSTLTDALGARLKEDLLTSVHVRDIQRSGEEWQVTIESEAGRDSFEARAVLMATPAYVTADFLRDIDNIAASTLEEIPYARVAMIFAGYDSSRVPLDLDGFGYLIPEKENFNTLGTIWSSTVFPGRAPEGRVCFTTFMGGRRQPEKLELSDEELLAEMLEDFSVLMGIDSEPEKVFQRRWPKAIPQYTRGHLEREKQMDEFERRHPGLFITGNHRGGISVADCIKNSGPRADNINSYLVNNQQER